MVDRLDKYDGEKDLNTDEIVAVLPPDDWVRSTVDIGEDIR
jgi:hypothetical protein